MKKIAIRFMCVLSLASMLLVSGSCGDSPSVSDDTSTRTETSSVAETTDRFETGLEAVDYGGAEINFLIPDDGAGRWKAKELDAESETGDVLNDAVYKRNMAIEEKYNVDLVSVHYVRDEMISQLAKTVQIGDGEYDCAMIPLWDCLSASSQGLLLDLNELDNLDLDAEWWDKKANASISLGGKQLYAVGDINIMSWDGTAAAFFNKHTIENYQLDDPYELVDSGKWTLDRYIKMTVDLSDDLDQDGKMGLDDFWGAIGSDDTVWSMLNSCGVYVVNKDSDDLPVFHTLDQKYSDLLEKLTLCEDIEKTFNVWRSNPAEPTLEPNLIHAFNIFAADRSVIYADVVELANGFRDYDTEFGIVPYPKYDEDQKEYISPMNAYASTTITIPVSVSDTDRISRIIEDMAAESAKIVRPAYYDVTLQVKLTRDERSAEMLDLIFSNRVFDLGWLINPANIKTSGIIEPMLKKNNDFASVYAKLTKSAEASIEKVIESLTDNSAG